MSIKLGKETYGTKDITETFIEALAPYFTPVSKEKPKEDKKAG